MLTPFLPKHIDNDYRGHVVAPWLLGTALLLKIAMSVNSIFNGAYVAGNADGIPLDRYPAEAAATIVALFGLWGVSHLALMLLGVLVLVRYRSAVPLVFAVLLAEQLGRKAVVALHPIASRDTSVGSPVTYALYSLVIVGLALSLWARRGPGDHSRGDSARARPTSSGSE